VVCFLVTSFGEEMGLKGLFFLVRGARTGEFIAGEEGRLIGEGGISVFFWRGICFSFKILCFFV